MLRCQLVIQLAMHAEHQSSLCISHDRAGQEELYAKVPMSKIKIKNVHLAV